MAIRWTVTFMNDKAAQIIETSQIRKLMVSTRLEAIPAL